ncbi:hypothetical protein [Defluviimonas sp. SAOS-178_SWC]|uniref:hypothetical protein n=1 Tax=Defluviimonas sp. SAOS-178_SWC TaxID=3121287 RepID=UPI003221BE8B
MDLTVADPKGLIRESYAIEGISLGECRSIFLDWALSLAAGTDTREALRVLISHYPPGALGHPMNGVLTAGLAAPPKPARRGGRAARIAPDAGTR